MRGRCSLELRRGNTVGTLPLGHAESLLGGNASVPLRRARCSGLGRHRVCLCRGARRPGLQT